MKMVKSLILSSAAALLAVSGAQAADLPVKAKAVEYVRICSLYGAGFYFIPGTDTCIKLSGYLRVDVLANTNSDASGNLSGAGGAQNRFTNAFTWRSREDFDIDTRTATEYGTVRTFFDATFSWTDDTQAGLGTGASVYSSIGGVQAPNNANSGAVAGGAVGVYYAFIQFAGFTMGKAISPFSAPWQNYPGNSFDGLVGGGGTVTGVNQFTYDMQFGGGVSGTIAAVDPTQYYQAGINNTALAGGGFGTGDAAGTSFPDIQGKLAVDQAWGAFQVTAALHNNHAAYYTAPAFSGTELAGHPDDKLGYAVGAALSIKNIPTGAGDVINIQGVYTNGATRYNLQDLSSAGASTYFSGTNVPGAYQSVGFGIAPDTVFGAIPGIGNTSQQLVETYGMRGGYTHNWDPYWNSSIYGAYAAIRYNGTSQTLICGTAGVGGSFRATYGAGVIGCNPDYNIAQIGLVTRWTPVKNLAFIADLTYQHLDQNMTGTATFGSAGIGKPTAVYAFKDQDAVSLLLRAQRNW